MPMPGNNTIEVAQYEQLLTHYCALLGVQGIEANVVDNTSGRFETEPRRVIQIVTDNKRGLYGPLHRLPNARHLGNGGKNAIILHVFGHEPQTPLGHSLLWVADNLDHVLNARVLDDKRILLYFTDGSSAVLTVESAERQE
jgi:hypothetical protein